MFVSSWLVCLLAMPGAVAPEADAENSLDVRVRDRQSYRDEFSSRDVNGDGQLDFDEFSVRDRTAQKARQQFVMFDSDADGKLSWAEFEAFPGGRPDTDRKIIDPVQDLYERSLAQVGAILGAPNNTTGRSWTAKDWPADRLAGFLPDAELSAFAVWDHNGDGIVDWMEVQRYLRLCTGLDSFLEPPAAVRLPHGRVFSAAYFQAMDTNDDQRLSRDEFIARYHRGPEKSAEIFDEIDANQDLFIDRIEILAGDWFFTIIVDEFCLLDENMDGQIDSRELARRGYPWHQSLAALLLPAFDDNGDGHLSFVEFRRSPPANPILDWYRPPLDRDFDGRLSFPEFFPAKNDEPKIWLVLLRKTMFDRFDRNRNGALEFDEFPFTVDGKTAPLELAFRIRDKDHDGALTSDEIFDIPRPDAGNSDAVLHYHVQRMRSADAFVSADANHDQTLSVAEFSQYNDFMQEKNPQPGISSAIHPARAGRDWMSLLIYGVTGLNLLLAIVGTVVWKLWRTAPFQPVDKRPK